MSPERFSEVIRASVAVRHVAVTLLVTAGSLASAVEVIRTLMP